jgi:FkbM family methyltransferase
VILDVGANIGQTSKALHERFGTARIHALEPVPDTFATLQREVASLHGVQCHALGLSDRSGPMTMLAAPNSVYSSLSGDALRDDPTARKIEIRLQTLDEFMRENRIEQIDILKTDTEGHDLAVMHGGADAFQNGRIDSVYTEVTFSHQNQQNTRFDVMYDFMTARGMRFMGLYELYFFQTKSWDTAFCNALFIRDDLLT